MEGNTHTLLCARHFTCFNCIRAKLLRFSSVAQSCLTLQPHGLQHARLPCPSPTPGAYSNSSPSSRWCHLILYHPLLLPPSIFPGIRVFPMSQFFLSGGQRIGVSASALVLPMNIQDWFPLGLTGWISLLAKGLSRVFSNTTVQKYQSVGAQLSSWSNSHIHTWLLEKPELWLDRLLWAKECLCLSICCLGWS